MSVKPKTCFWLVTLFTLLTLSLLFPFQDVNPDQPQEGKLSNAHSQLSGTKNCLKCHSSKKEIEPAKCLNCHPELARRIQADRGYHRDKNDECGSCHQEHQGENHHLIQWDTTDFDHSETGYLLIGSHKKIMDCHRCHNPVNTPNPRNLKSYLIKDNKCSACHQDPHRGNFPNCTECHSTKDWKVEIW